MRHQHQHLILMAVICRQFAQEPTLVVRFIREWLAFDRGEAMIGKIVLARTRVVLLLVNYMLVSTAKLTFQVDGHIYIASILLL